MAILGLIIILLLLGSLMVAGGGIGLFYDIPTLFIILGFALGALLLSGTNISTMFRAVFSSTTPRTELETAAQGWERARIFLLGGGWISTMVGSVIMLAHLDDFGAIGPGLSIALLAIFWALVLAYGICRPLQYKLEDRAREAI